MIVVEGPDNAGKTTLAEAIGLQRYTAGPAPRDARELTECLLDQRARASMPCVQDRLTCISQQVYSDAPESGLLGEALREFVKIPMVVVVYCRPPQRILMDLSKHKIKSYDTEESLKKIIDNQHTYIERYDAIMATIPHIQFDWTEYLDFVEADRGEIIRYLVNTQYSMEAWQEYVRANESSRTVVY